MPLNKIKNLNRSAARPHAFIVLWVFKHVRRICTRLMGTVSISLHQTAPGLSCNANRWRRHLPYDKNKRACVRDRNFQPHFISPRAENHLCKLRAVDQGPFSHEQSLISVFPGYWATTMPACSVTASPDATCRRQFMSPQPFK